MQNNTPFALAAVLVALALAAVAAALSKRKTQGTFPTKPRAPLTRAEQAMYWRLKEAFPDSVVLAQVAFSSLITSAREHRNRYSQKVADFVLCDRSMTVIAVIELDDSSHKGREAADGMRAAMLERAGYRLIRFPRVPDVEPLRARLGSQTPTAAPVAK